MDGDHDSGYFMGFLESQGFPAKKKSTNLLKTNRKEPSGNGRQTSQPKVSTGKSSVSMPDQRVVSTNEEETVTDAFQDLSLQEIDDSYPLSDEISPKTQRKKSELCVDDKVISSVINLFKGRGTRGHHDITDEVEYPPNWNKDRRTSTMSESSTCGISQFTKDILFNQNVQTKKSDLFDGEFSGQLEYLTPLGKRKKRKVRRPVQRFFIPYSVLRQRVRTILRDVSKKHDDPDSDCEEEWDDNDEDLGYEIVPAIPGVDNVYVTAPSEYSYPVQKERDSLYEMELEGVFKGIDEDEENELGEYYEVPQPGLSEGEENQLFNDDLVDFDDTSTSASESASDGSGPGSSKVTPKKEGQDADKGGQKKKGSLKMKKRKMGMKVLTRKRKLVKTRSAPQILTPDSPNPNPSNELKNSDETSPPGAMKTPEKKDNVPEIILETPEGTAENTPESEKKRKSHRGSKRCSKRTSPKLKPQEKHDKWRSSRKNSPDAKLFRKSQRSSRRTSPKTMTTESSPTDAFEIFIKNDKFAAEVIHHEVKEMNLKIYYETNKTGLEDMKDFKININDVIANRYQILDYIGSAVFSHAVACYDLRMKRPVCLKITKNKKEYFDNCLDEIRTLSLLQKECEKCCVLKMYEYFYYKEHLIIVTELLKENLYELAKFAKNRNDEYFTLPVIRSIAKQILKGLKYVHSKGLIHCDLKPENIVIKEQESATIKIIDFGTSCYEHDNLCVYVQSRTYRAPEVIIGATYGKQIDVWSLGCILFELYTNEVLFINSSIQSLLARIVGVCGKFDISMLEGGRYTSNFFTSDLKRIWERTKSGKIVFLNPLKTKMANRLGKGLKDDHCFVDFVKKCLLTNPDKRISVDEALKHPFVTF